ncbi:MAG TPA: PQQ-binding-like beta-propeller repeat protein [Solirubrobacterales bacterium]
MGSRGKAAASFIAGLAAMIGVLALAGAAGAAAEPVTASNDALRTGWYPDEPKLDPATVAGGKFGQIFETPVQGQVYAQPLVADGTLLVVTEKDRAYGLDPLTGAVKWERKVGDPFPSSELPGCTDMEPDVGITGTPVIDPETGIAYFYSKTYSESPKTATYQLRALRMADGEEAPGFPVTIGGEAENLSPHPEFVAKRQLQRPGLLLMDGVVYAGFGSHCDILPYQGWLVGVSTSTAQVRTMWATSPLGSAIWQGGGGLVSDGPGQILFATGNSFVEPTPPPSPTPSEDLGESVGRVQIGPAGEATATDFFSPWNRQELDERDQDLGSSAPTALPSRYFGTEAVPNLMLVAGKDRKIFILNRDHLGGQGQSPTEKNDILGEIVNEHPVVGSMAVWPGEGGYVFVPGVGETGGLEILKYSPEGELPKFELIGKTSDPLTWGSGSPIVTSEGTTPGSAIVWEEQCPDFWPCAGSTLNAYKAVPEEGEPPLWQAPIGIASKFGRPGVADGRIYVGTLDERVIGFGVATAPPPNQEVTGGGGTGQAGPGPSTPTATPRPWTKLKTVSLHRAAGRVTFRFASEAGAGFECRLQRIPRTSAHSPAPAPFRRCASPRTYRHLAHGRYRFQVRAVNAAGPDRSPAGRRFTLF